MARVHFVLVLAVAIALSIITNTVNPLADEIPPILSKTDIFNFSVENELFYDDSIKDKVTFTSEGLELEQGATRGILTSEVITASIPFSDVGVHWKAELPPGTEILIKIRTSKENNEWTSWQQVSVESYPNQNRKEEFFSSLIGIEQKDRTHNFIQYRVTLISRDKGISPTLARICFTFIDAGVTPPSFLEKIKHYGRKNNLEAHFFAQYASYPKPSIVSRAGWGCNESLMTWPPQYEPVTHIIIHHTATPNTDTDWAARVRSIYYYHAVTKGWGDIGYNYLVDPNGVLYEGRYGGDDVIGAHAYGYNDGTMGLAFLGTYSNTSPSSVMLNSAEELLAWKCDQRSIDPLGSGPDNDGAVYPYICGHRDVANTECPGDKLYNLLPTIRQNVQNLISGEQLTVYDFWRKDDPIYADPSSSCSNQNFDAQYKVRNDGSQSITIERLALAIHDSNNNHLWDLCIQNTCNPRYYDNVSLEPGETHWFERSFCYFQEGGNFKVVAKAKIDGVWYHLSSMDFEVKEQTLPDLIVENIWTDPAEFYPGDTVKLYARIKNIGDGDAVGTFRVQRYFDGDPISHYDKDGLAAGATITTYFTYTWPSDYNQHTIKVIVDLYDDITESNEDNNERSESFSASSPTLSSIDVTGPTSVNENSGAQYTCTAYWSDGSTSNVTSSATWSENSPYASIGSSGYLTTIEVSSDKSCRVTASYSGKTDYLDITIKNVTYPLSYITISGPTEVNEDSGAQYTCTAHYTDGSSSDVTNSASWSENSPYATISSTGYLTTSSVSSDQSCQITATYSGKSDNHNITIKNVNHPPELSSGDVSPDSGDTSTIFTYTVKYYDQDGDSPSAKYVYIDGSPHTMSLYTGSASNGTYRYRTTLSAGSHNYYFYFTDGNGGSDRLPSSGTHSGPTVCPIPGTPANPNPSDGATNVSIDTDLDWSDCANTDSYDVYFGECPNPEYRDTASGSSYNLPTLDYDTHYCWKIVAKNNCGNSTPGPVWDFTTGTCTCSIYPTSKHFGPSGGTGSVDVTTQSGCAWTATSNDSWIHITSGSSGTGSGTVNYSVDENTGSARTGTITIANETFTVTQSGTSTHKPMPWLHLLLEE